MIRDCRAVRRAVYERVLRELETLPQDQRELVAYLMATADCQGLRDLKGFMEWESLRWMIEPKGKNPLELLKEVEKAVCSCYVPARLLAALAFLAGLAIGYLASLILG